MDKSGSFYRKVVSDDQWVPAIILDKSNSQPRDGPVTYVTGLVSGFETNEKADAWAWCDLGLWINMGRDGGIRREVGMACKLIGEL
ncbi:MAG: hypothetical protein WA476_03830 [Acidobacteriaceae bacterium]